MLLHFTFSLELNPALLTLRTASWLYGAARCPVKGHPWNTYVAILSQLGEVRSATIREFVEMGGVSSINSDLSFTGKIRIVEPLDILVEEEDVSLLVVCDYGTLIGVKLKQHK